jgi:PadR family transcriptional regulator PadR
MSGVPELLLLQLLARQEMYGYELARRARLVTREAISLGENVLYPVLHSLEARGLLRARRRTVGSRTRVYYAITGSGRRRLRELTRQWQRISGGVATALAGSGP